MSLTDVMSGAGLSRWAEIGLLLFFIAFVLIAIATWMRPRKEIDEASRLPLDNGTKPTNPRTPDEPKRG